MNNKARKLLTRARNSRAGWRSNELIQLYKSFGFEIRQGKDILASHPNYKNLRASISRTSGELAKGYINHAVRKIESLLKLQGECNE